MEDLTPNAGWARLESPADKNSGVPGRRFEFSGLAYFAAFLQDQFVRQAVNEQ